LNKVESRSSSKYQNKRKNRAKKVWLACVSLVIVLSLAGFFTYRHFSADQKAPTAEAPVNQINYDPPTEEEKQETENQKDQIINNTPTETSVDTAGKKVVKPVIASADKSGASAYITGIFEEGGTCTATYTHDNDKITTTSTGFQNSNYTSCAPLTLQSPLNISGNWELVVSYSSNQSAGSSAPQVIKVN